MISGSKGQKAVHACMIRLLNLRGYHVRDKIPFDPNMSKI